METTSMLANIRTFWFSTEELENLWVVLQEAKDVNQVNSPLRNVYQEVGVAQVRARWLTSGASRIAISLGYNADAVPLTFTTDELNALISLPLNANVKEVLN